MNRRLASFVLSAVALLLAPAALAGDAAEDGGSNRYLEIDVGAVWIEAPEVDGLAANFGTNPAPFPVPAKLDDEPDVTDWGAGFDVRFGFGVPGGALPKWNLELGGGWHKVESDESDASVVGEFASVQNVNGLVALGYFAGPSDVIHTDFDGEVKFWELHLAMVRAVEISESLGGRVRVGVVGGNLDQDYHVDHRVIPVGPPAGSSHDLDMELETFFVGGFLGADLAAEIGGLRLSLGAEVALLYENADLDVNQEYVGSLFATPVAGISLACSPSCLVKNNERDQVHRFGARPRLAASIDYDLGFAIVGVSGAVTYWSFVPQVVNPEAPVNGPAIFSRYGESHISGDDMTVANVGVRVTFPFGGGD